MDDEWMQFTESIVATSRWKSMEYATLHVLLEHYDFLMILTTKPVHILDCL